jgi:uncharacterized membrane-anchored protein YhcB (DUF1043 family)
MVVDPLVPVWLVVIASVVAGMGAGLLLERTRGPAAKRAAKFEADLVQARSELMRYQEETARHFGKSAELLGRMATDYRAFLDHFVSGAEELCGNGKQIGAAVLDRPLLDDTARTNGAAATNGAAKAVAPATVPPPGQLDREPLAEEIAT